LNKKILIISPYFPPGNAADMQRVRTSLPYFKKYGWNAEVVTVVPSYSDIQKDDLLVETIPTDIKIHTVKAFNKTWTSKLGIGNIALRSYCFYRKKVNELLKNEKFDLIYFSTTQFSICILGAYWKKRFGVPYVIDMQDPWHSEYYKDKPKHQQPPKYWFSYRLNKYLEPIAMKHVGGLISVSENYITDLQSRYPQIKHVPSATITFGIFEPDTKIAEKHINNFAALISPGFKNMVYVGRGGFDMHDAITPVFRVFKQCLIKQPELYNKLKLYFIGTSYAPSGKGIPTIAPLAKQFGIENNVIEITDRISYFHALITLQQADALFMPGSDDPEYTASKIFPYLLSKKPMLAIFNSKSPAINILEQCGEHYIYSYDATPEIDKYILSFLDLLINGAINKPDHNELRIEAYSAENKTKEQCELFNLVLGK
jgi:hypothetical protein